MLKPQIDAHISIYHGSDDSKFSGGKDEYARHVEYCYINPLKHGLVTRVRDWPYSSFHREVRAGLFPEDWAAIAKRVAISANGDDRAAVSLERRITLR